MASMLALIEGGETAWAKARALIADAASGRRVAAADVVLRAPIPLPPQFRDSMSFHKHIRQSTLSTRRRLARESGRPGAVEETERFAATYEVPQIYRDQPVYYKANRFNVADPARR